MSIFEPKLYVPPYVKIIVFEPCEFYSIFLIKSLIKYNKITIFVHTFIKYIDFY